MFLILRGTSKSSRGTADGVRKGIEYMDGKINDKQVIYMFLLKSLFSLLGLFLMYDNSLVINMIFEISSRFFIIILEFKS